MRPIVPLLQRVPLFLTLLVGGHLIVASDFVGGYLLLALTGFCWWVGQHVQMQFVLGRLAQARQQMMAMPSVLAVVVSIGFASAAIAMSLDRMIGF